MTIRSILRSRAFVIAGAAVAVCVLIIVALLRCGGYLLVRNDRLPTHADGAIVLQGSMISEDARTAGAIVLLQHGIVNRVLLSIPKTGYWGQSMPDLVRAYLEKTYGVQVSTHFEFCLTGPEVDSTEEEAEAIAPCIEGHHWRSVIVVTSNFHSRRAGMIWHRLWRHDATPVRIWIDGVPDPLFQPSGWWRRRLYAKTWFFESTKLLWTLASVMRNKRPAYVQDSAH